MLGWTLLVGALLVTVAVGVTVHELLHAVVLRSAGVDCSFDVLPADEDRSGFASLATGAVATVGIESVPSACSPWRLRLAALAPLVMLVPVVAYAALLLGGQVTETRLGSIVLIAWMACALPSPADFSIVWYPEETRKQAQDAA